MKGRPFWAAAAAAVLSLVTVAPVAGLSNDGGGDPDDVAVPGGSRESAVTQEAMDSVPVRDWYVTADPAQEVPASVAGALEELAETQSDSETNALFHSGKPYISYVDPETGELLAVLPYPEAIPVERLAAEPGALSLSSKSVTVQSGISNGSCTSSNLRINRKVGARYMCQGFHGIGVRAVYLSGTLSASAGTYPTTLTRSGGVDFPRIAAYTTQYYGSGVLITKIYRYP